MKYFLTLLFTLGFVVPLQSQDTVKTFPEEVLERFAFAPANSEIAMAVIHANSTYFQGWQKAGDELIRVDNAQHVFEIGSISKVFTSTFLANSVLAEQVALDDPVNSYVDYELNKGIQFTFKQLANHTSGLPRMPDNFGLSAIKSPLNPFRYYDEEMLQEYLTRNMKQKPAAGEGYRYSNLGAGLLGHLMTEITDASYEHLLDSLLTGRFNMTRTTTIRSDISAHLVPGLNALGKETPNWDFLVLVGAGGILSTVYDLSLFAHAQFEEDNEDLTLTRQFTFDGPGSTDLGLGWHIVNEEGSKKVHWHNGGTAGYSSCMAINVAEKTAVIILSNISAFNPKHSEVTKYCLELIQRL